MSTLEGKPKAHLFTLISLIFVLIIQVTFLGYLVGKDTNIAVAVTAIFVLLDSSIAALIWHLGYFSQIDMFLSQTWVFGLSVAFLLGFFFWITRDPIGCINCELDGNKDVWDGKPCGDGNPIYFAISNNNAYVASVYQQPQICITEPSSSSEPKIRSPHNTDIQSLCFLPSDELLTLHSDGMGTRSHITDNTADAKIISNAPLVTVATCHPNNYKIVTGNSEGILQLFEVQGSTLSRVWMAELGTQINEIDFVGRFSGNISVGAENGYVFMIDSEDGEILWSGSDGDDPILDIDSSPDEENVFAVATNNTIRTLNWNGTDLDVRNTIRDTNITSVSFDPNDSKYLAVGTCNTSNNVSVYNREVSNSEPVELYDADCAAWVGYGRDGNVLTVSQDNLYWSYDTSYRVSSQSSQPTSTREQSFATLTPEITPSSTQSLTVNELVTISLLFPNGDSNTRDHLTIRIDDSNIASLDLTTMNFRWIVDTAEQRFNLGELSQINTLVSNLNEGQCIQLYSSPQPNLSVARCDSVFPDPITNSDVFWEPRISLFNVYAGDILITPCTTARESCTFEWPITLTPTTLISNDNYRQCHEDGNGVCSTPPEFSRIFENHEYGTYPVVGVSWVYADIYCRSNGGRLPTSDELVALGTDRIQELSYWVNILDPTVFSDLDLIEWAIDSDIGNPVTVDADNIASERPDAVGLHVVFRCLQ